MKSLSVKTPVKSLSVKTPEAGSTDKARCILFKRVVKAELPPPTLDTLRLCMHLESSSSEHDMAQSNRTITTPIESGW